MKLSFKNLFVFAAFLLIISCDKPSPQAPNNDLAESSSNHLIQYLIDLGFKSNMIEEG